MTYKAPKAIINHPAVLSCTSALDEGADEYRHYIELKDGWVMPRGHRNEGGASTFCNKVSDFTDWQPVRVAPGFRQGDEF